MKSESWLAMLGGLLVALRLLSKKLLKLPRKLSVNYQRGNDTSKISVITSSSSEENEKED